MSSTGRKFNRRQHSFFSAASVVLILSILASSSLAGCSPRAADLAAIDYTPIPEGDWKTSTPEEQGLDPRLLDKLYIEAEKLETLYGLLVIKNGSHETGRHRCDGSRSPGGRGGTGDDRETAP